MVYLHTQSFQLELETRSGHFRQFHLQLIFPHPGGEETCAGWLSGLSVEVWEGDWWMRVCSYQKTPTHNSHCTLVTDPIIAHWPFQTMEPFVGTRSLLEVWPRRSGPGRGQKVVLWLPLNPLFLTISDSLEESLLAPISSFLQREKWVVGLWGSLYSSCHLMMFTKF